MTERDFSFWLQGFVERLNHVCIERLNQIEIAQIIQDMRQISVHFVQQNEDLIKRINQISFEVQPPHLDDVLNNLKTTVKTLSYSSEETKEAELRAVIKATVKLLTDTTDFPTVE